MISIIVCSINQENFDNFSKSVNETIGTEFEIIKIDNNFEKIGICEAYNKGILLSKFPYLCFVHEDVIFKTENWGKNLIQHFNTLVDVGVLGVAGCEYKSFAPSSWIESAEYLRHCYILQSFKYSKTSEKLIAYNNKSVHNVVWLDGVFLGVKKEIAEKIYFDTNIKGFHCYDIDFCISVSKIYRNYFIPDVLLQHFSEGKADNDWILNAFIIFKKWKSDLPKLLNEKNVILSQIEFSLFDSYLIKLANSTIPLLKKLEIWIFLFLSSFSKLNITFKFLNIFFIYLFYLSRIELYRLYLSLRQKIVKEDLT